MSATPEQDDTPVYTSTAEMDPVGAWAVENPPPPLDESWGEWIGTHPFVTELDEPDSVG